MTWRISLTPTARAMLEAIEDRRVREKIRDRIDGLAAEPEKQGKPLTGEFKGAVLASYVRRWTPDAPG